MNRVPTWGHMDAATRAFKDRLRENNNLPQDQRELPEPLARYVWDALGAAMAAAIEYDDNRPTEKQVLQLGPEVRPEEV